MARQERWSYKRDGLTREVVLQERWPDKRDGLTREVVLQERWSYKRGGLTRGDLARGGLVMREMVS